VVKFLPKLARAVRIVNEEASLADEVVVVFGESLRSRKSYGVADVAKSVIAVDLNVVVASVLTVYMVSLIDL
jgi:hypothetical protein